MSGTGIMAGFFGGLEGHFFRHVRTIRVVFLHIQESPADWKFDSACTELRLGITGLQRPFAVSQPYVSSVSSRPLQQCVAMILY